MTSSAELYIEKKLRLRRDRSDLYEQAAADRGLSWADWARRVLDEEIDRQAALLLYRYRSKHPGEIDALVEETLRNRNNR